MPDGTHVHLGIRTLLLSAARIFLHAHEPHARGGRDGTRVHAVTGTQYVPSVRGRGFAFSGETEKDADSLGSMTGPAVLTAD